MAVCAFAFVGQHSNDLAPIESLPHRHCMIIMVDCEPHVCSIIIILIGMCADLIERGYQFVESSVGVVFREPQCLSVNGIE